MPTYTLTDPAILAFVIIPLALVGTLLWGISTASRRLQEADRVRRRALGVTFVVAAVWMAASLIAAATGVLREWDATPPPFALLVLGIIGLSAAVRGPIRAVPAGGRGRIRGLKRRTVHDISNC